MSDMMEAGASERLSYEPLDLMTQLKGHLGEAYPDQLPDRLPLSAIRRIPELFQMRAMDERHISELTRVISNFGMVEPITVIQVGRQAILLDGHHRLEAYARAKHITEIPVRYFTGSVEDALLEAGAANSKAKLPMTTQERQDYAWRLVLMGEPYSKAMIASASCVSTTQVAIMRTAKKKLGGEAFNIRSWWQARKRAQGSGADMTDEEREHWKEQLANSFADRLAKEFGSKLSQNPEVTAMALAIYFGRRLEAVHQELRGHLPEHDEFSEGDY